MNFNSLFAKIIGGIFFLIVATLFFYIRACLNEKPPQKVAIDLPVNIDGGSCLSDNLPLYLN